MLALADYEVVRQDSHLVFPAYVPLLSDFLNRYVGRLPGFQQLSLMYGIIARPAPHRFARARDAQHQRDRSPAATRPATSARWCERLPDLGPGSEFLFVEGNSTDDTEAGDPRRRSPRTRSCPLRLLKQTGQGQGRRGAAGLRAGARATSCSSSTPTWAWRRRTCPSSCAPWPAARAR